MTVIKNIPNKWSIVFCIKKTLEHEILKINSKGKELLSVYLHGNNMIEVVAFFNKKDKALVLFSRYDNSVDNKVCLNFSGYKFELYVNGILQDEEWPLGIMELEDSECILCPDGFLILPHKEEKKMITKPVKVSIRSFKPAGHNTFAGDCMPFEHNGTYHLFYLYDRRRHGSKYGLGAHQWGHLATDNLTDWFEYPMAVSIDHQYEGSICTGSFIHNEGKYYAFYAVRMSDGSPANITWAESNDCIDFTKSIHSITLSPGYDSASARDPKVFYGEDNMFHMLVTTSHNKESNKKGCLAHLISKDLKTWVEKEEAFLTVDTEDQPECPDYFKFGDWYYLIYSLRGQAEYLISKSPFSNWQRVDNNLIGTISLRVPKLALFNKNRLIAAGFIPVISDGYAGELSLLEVHQNKDGSLRFSLVKEII